MHSAVDVLSECVAVDIERFVIRDSWSAFLGAEWLMVCAHWRGAICLSCVLFRQKSWVICMH